MSSQPCLNAAKFISALDLNKVAHASTVGSYRQLRPWLQAPAPLSSVMRVSLISAALPRIRCCCWILGIPSGGCSTQLAALQTSSQILCSRVAHRTPCSLWRKLGKVKQSSHRSSDHTVTICKLSG